VDRGGLRLKLFKAQAEAGDIVRLFADESEALTHPYLARAWAKKGADLRVPAPGQAQKTAMMGSLDYARRRLIVTTSRTKRSSDFIAHLQALDRLYGPRPGAPTKPVVLVLDNGPIHVSKASRTALAERAHWLTVEWLPKYAPELNDIEIVWGDLKARQLAHRTFTDLDSLETAVHDAVADLNSARNRDPLDSQRISAMKMAAQAPASHWPNSGFEDDFIAEPFEAAFEIGDGSGLADLIEVGFAEVAIGQVLGEHVIGGDEDFVGDGECGAQGAAAGLETVELVLEIAALCSRGGDRGADQYRAEVDIALSGAAALLPAGALVAARTDAGPGAQVIDAQEHAHVDADLGDEHRGDKPVDTGDLH
jgi:transposase